MTDDSEVWLRLKALMVEVSHRVDGPVLFEEGAKIRVHHALAKQLAKPKNATLARVLEAVLQERLEYRQRTDEAIAWLAARGLIYDTGERRKGKIVWRTTPGKEAELKALQKEAEVEDGAEE